MANPQPRVSWDALWDYASRRGITSVAELATRCGVERRSLQRFKAEGAITEATADRIAVALGEVPDAIWGEEWAEATAGMVAKADAEEAAEREAKELAETARRAKRAAKMRRFRERHPDYAERQRVAARQYKVDARSYVLAYNRKYNRDLRARQRQMATGERADNVA